MQGCLTKNFSLRLISAALGPKSRKPKRRLRGRIRSLYKNKSYQRLSLDIRPGWSMVSVIEGRGRASLQISREILMNTNHTAPAADNARPEAAAIELDDIVAVAVRLDELARANPDDEKFGAHTVSSLRVILDLVRDEVAKRENWPVEDDEDGCRGYVTPPSWQRLFDEVEKIAREYYAIVEEFLPAERQQWEATRESAERAEN
jgi:hypothetical protein